MGICIDKLPHSCGTKQGLQVFAHEDTGQVDGWCFSCNTFIRHPYGKEKTIDDIELPEPKTPEQIEAEIKEIVDCGVQDIKPRKLRGETLNKFGAKVAVSQSDGKTPVAVYYPIHREGAHTGYFAKTLGKPTKTWFVGDGKDAEPFNWHQARGSGAYTLVITEGPDDMVAVQRLSDLYGDEKFPVGVISLPRGSGSVRSSLTPLAPIINKTFKSVVLCFDMDPVGRKAVEEALYLLPNAKVAELPCKDANDCLIEGKGRAAFNAIFFNASSPRNSRILNLQDVLKDAREPTQRGELTWPYGPLDQALRGIRYGETIYIGAGVKMGKTAVKYNLAAHFINEHNVNIFMASPEEDIKKQAKLFAGVVAGQNFMDPDIDFNYDLYDEATKKIGDKVQIIDIYQHVNWNTLKADIIYGINQGAKVVFIDPITNLTRGMDPGEANTKLQEIATDLSAIAKDMQVVVFIFCHLKAPDGALGKDARRKKYDNGEYYGLGNHPHEYGGDVLSNQFAGSRAMMQACHLMIGIEGNKDKELPDDIRRRRWLTVLEDREFGNSDSFPIIFDTHTTRYRSL